MTENTRKKRWTRLINKLGLGSLAVGIFAGVAKAWVTHWLGPSTVPKTPVVPPVAAIVAPAGPTTIEELLNHSPIKLADWQSKLEDLTNNDRQRERFFHEYLGREVVWEGFFDQCNFVVPEGQMEESGVLIIYESWSMLHNKPLLGPPFIRCWFPASAKAKLSQLKRGDWIVIKGRLSDPMLNGSLLCTDLNPCELIAAEKVRNLELAIESSTPRLVR